MHNVTSLPYISFAFQPPQKNPSFPSFVDSKFCNETKFFIVFTLLAIYPLRFSSVPGPCEPEDLVNGIIFAANYLGSTQLLSDRNPSKSIRMKQAQEALDCVKVL